MNAKIDSNVDPKDLSLVRMKIQCLSFIIGEFSFYLKKGEEVEMYCSKCNGTIGRKIA